MTWISCHSTQQKQTSFNLRYTCTHKANRMNFVPFCIYFTPKISMVTPKFNIWLTFVGKTRNSPTRNLFIHWACETQGSSMNNVNFTPFTGPGSSYSTLMNERYLAGRILSFLNILHLTEPLYLVETQNDTNFEQLQAPETIIQCPRWWKIF